MTDPVILRCTDKFIEILDSNASSLHILRLDALMHVRSSNSHVFLSTNTLNASISFTFKDISKVAPFINKIIDTLGKEVSFRQVEQDLSTLSEKFEEFKKELEPTLVELIEQDRVGLSEKFEKFMIQKKEPLFPEAPTSPVCEAGIMFISLFLLCLFIIPLMMHPRQ